MIDVARPSFEWRPLTVQSPWGDLRGAFHFISVYGYEVSWTGFIYPKVWLRMAMAIPIKINPRANSKDIPFGQPT